MLAAGIDLGLDGALAVVEAETRKLTHLWDMPTLTIRRGKGERRAIDIRGLSQFLQTFADIGVTLVAIEEPGYRQGQRGSGTVGFGAGLTVMGCVMADPPMRYEIVSANAWKSSMKLTSNKAYSIRMAETMWPVQASWFHGPKGAALDGRAEAALLAEFGIRRFLKVWR